MNIEIILLCGVLVIASTIFNVVEPKYYKEEEQLIIYSNKIKSSKNVIQYDYSQFDFCFNEESKNLQDELLSEGIFSSVLKITSYKALLEFHINFK